MSDPEASTSRIEPPDLLTDWPADRLWWAVHCRPRQEKALADDLSAAGLAYYLPMIRREPRRGTRSRPSIVPVFAGYLFMCVDEAGRLVALRTNRIANLLRVTDPHKLTTQLHTVETMIRARLPIYTDQRIGVGKPVRVVGGPLTGCEGRVLRIHRAHRFVVDIDMLGTAVAAEVEATNLEPLDS